MEGDLIRRTFLEYFQGKGHTVMPSSSLVPAGDPTLLFTSAGMVPFKPYFMGEATPPSLRLTSCQKSFRTTDVDEVGDHKHLTFFEMLGNFSIGDYFKKEAIAWSWEFVTQRLKLPAERLYVTIYLDDEEAYGYWTQDIGVPAERIYRYGDKDNWWGPAGKEGPCGPCSEIHYDGGVEYGCGTSDCHPNHDCERFVELWNLVFMQFYQDLEGKRTPLPAPSIDTGLGLERAAAILQGVRNLYETDLFRPIIERACQVSGMIYGEDRDTDYALRVVAEHSRAAVFLIGDGVVPGNEGRGYVLRRSIRRAIRYGRMLGLDEPFLTQVAEAAIQRFQDTYPELSTNRDFVLRVVALEEERFGEAFERGSGILKGMVDRRQFVKQQIGATTRERGAVLFPQLIMSRNEDENAGHEIAHSVLLKVLASSSSTETGVATWAPRVSGEETFVLYDTYGFPPELTAEIAREHGMSVDMEGFEAEMEAQRERARAAHAFTGAMEMLPAYEGLGVGGVEFVGYERLAQDSVVAALGWWILRRAQDRLLRRAQIKPMRPWATLRKASTWRWCFRRRHSTPRRGARWATLERLPAPMAAYGSKTPRAQSPASSSIGVLWRRVTFLWGTPSPPALTPDGAWTPPATTVAPTCSTQPCGRCWEYMCDRPAPWSLPTGSGSTTATSVPCQTMSCWRYRGW